MLVSSPKNLNEATFLIFFWKFDRILNRLSAKKNVTTSQKKIIIYCNPKLDIRSMRTRLRTRTTRTRRMREADEYTELMKRLPNPCWKK